MAVEPARASLIDGKAFSQTLVERVAAAAARLESAHGVKPGLAVVIVGEDPASQLYVRNKGETTLKAGMRSDTHRLPAETTQAELLALIASLNADADVGRGLGDNGAGRQQGDGADRPEQGRELRMTHENLFAGVIIDAEPQRL